LTEPLRSYVELWTSPYSKAVDEEFERCASEIHRSEDTKSMSGLLQAVLGEAAKLPQPRL